MKERPILFSGPMVRAILSGRKVQTRRIVKLDSLKLIPRENVRGDWIAASTMVRGGQKTPAAIGGAGAVCGLATNGKWLGLKPGEFDLICPYADGKTELINDKWHITPNPNQRLWVRETWGLYDREGIPYFYFDGIPKSCPEGFHVAYPADDDSGTIREVFRWRPSIHMPPWASRITLEITGVRVERLQEITEADARDEGADSMLQIPHPGFDWCAFSTAQGGRYKEGFRYIWQSINGPESWEANPWVWVIDFQRVAET